MTDLVSIFLANLSYALIGIGLAAALGVFDRRPATFVRGLVGIPLGIAVVLLLAGYGAVAGVALTPTLVSLVAVGALAAGAWRLRRPAESELPVREVGPRLLAALAVVPAAAIAWVLAAAGRAAAVKPLAEWDGWVLWATKARILYEHPSEGAAVLQSSFYGAPSYPLGLPALEATTMRAVGDFDGTLLDVQLLALVAAAMVGIWALLHRAAHPVTIGLALLATLGSTQLAYQLTTNYADVPLAFLVALGVVAGGVWLTGPERETWQLACFSVFLAAAAWAKNEGLVFGAAAVVTLVLATLITRSGRRAALLASLAWAMLVAPWRVYAQANGLQTADYDLRDLFDLGLLHDRADRVWPAARELIAEMTAAGAWGATAAVIVLSLATALLTSRRLAGWYAAAWLLLSFGGLVATYWISNHRLDNDLENSSYRTIVTLLVTGLCIAPLLLDAAVARALAGIHSTRAAWLATRRTQ